MKRRQSIAISDNHRRRISVTLALLDKTLCELEHWAGAGQWRSVLYQQHNALTPVQRRRILAELSAMRTIMQRLADQLRLAPKVQLVSQAIRSRCAAHWTSLIELEEKHLRRYGTVPRALADALEPNLAELVRHLQRISEVTGERSTKRGARNAERGARSELADGQF